MTAPQCFRRHLRPHTRMQYERTSFQSSAVHSPRSANLLITLGVIAFVAKLGIPIQAVNLGYVDVGIFFFKLFSEFRHFRVR
jgi:hypothetical protein